MTAPHLELFPPFVQALPRAHVPIPGCAASLLQGERQQVLFMAFAQDATLPEHAHCAQWGLVVAGEITLTIAGRTATFRPGERYVIAAGEPHSGLIRAGYADVTVFDAPDRYAVERAAG